MYVRLSLNSKTVRSNYFQEYILTTASVYKALYCKKRWNLRNRKEQCFS